MIKSPSEHFEKIFPPGRRRDRAAAEVAWNGWSTLFKMPRVKQTARKNFTGPVKGKAARKAESLGVKNQGGVKKQARKHRWHPGTVALREVKKLQKTTDSILAKAPFIRLVREIAADFKDEVRFTGGAQGALAALQTASEDYIIELFEKANIVAIEVGGDVTLRPRHLRAVLRARNDPFVPHYTVRRELPSKFNMTTAAAPPAQAEASSAATDNEEGASAE